MELRPGSKDDLKHTLQAFFAAINKMMAEENPVAAGSKSKLLRSYAFVLQVQPVGIVVATLPHNAWCRS